MIYDADAPIVVLSPHLDDAILSTFHVLTSGDPVQVVNVFAGVPPPGTETGMWGRLCGYDDAHDYGEARIREDVAALDSVGVAPVYLPLAENSVRTTLGDQPPSVDVLLGEIEAVAPRASLVLAPLGGADKPHPDHVLVRTVAIDLLYDGMPVALYADFPHVCKARGAWPREIVCSGLFENVDGHESGIGVFSVGPDELRTNGQAVKLTSPGAPARWPPRLPVRLPEIDPLYNATIWVLDGYERVRKRAAAEMYRTQFKALDTKLRTKGLVSDPALYGVEVAVPLAAR